MAENIDELTIHYEEDGKILRKEVAKEVLSKGSWATIMYLYQDLDRKTEEYGKQKVSIRRYQKRDGIGFPKKNNRSIAFQIKKGLGSTLIISSDPRP